MTLTYKQERDFVPAPKFCGSCSRLAAYPGADKFSLPVKGCVVTSRMRSAGSPACGDYRAKQEANRA